MSNANLPSWAEKSIGSVAADVAGANSTVPLHDSNPDAFDTVDGTKVNSMGMKITGRNKHSTPVLKGAKDDAHDYIGVGTTKTRSIAPKRGVAQWGAWSKQSGGKDVWLYSQTTNDKSVRFHPNEEARNRLLTLRRRRSVDSKWKMHERLTSK